MPLSTKSTWLSGTVSSSLLPQLCNAPSKSIIDIWGNYGLHNLQDLPLLIGGVDKALDLVQALLNTLENAFNEWFDNEVVEAPLARLASGLGGPPPRGENPGCHFDDDGTAPQSRHNPPSCNDLFNRSPQPNGAKQLIKSGFTMVYSITGGIMEWWRLGL